MSWRPPKIWNQGTCFILGGGPSLIEQFEIPKEIVAGVRDKELPPAAYSPYLKDLHDKHVIGVNTAYLFGDWVDITIFGDHAWYLANRMSLAEYSGIKVSCFPKVQLPYEKEHIRHMDRNREHRVGISPNNRKVCWGTNTGSAAISLAAHLGVKRIVLLGFDMNRDTNSQQHWHNIYRDKNAPMNAKNLPFERQLACYPYIARDAKQLGIEILNASPNSAIDCFPKLTMKEIWSKITNDEK